jgi:hypothetical protein
MLAAAMRLLGFSINALMLPATILSDACLFLAFLLIAHRMIEALGGQTRLGILGFRDQLRLARKVGHRVLLLLALVCAAVWFAAGQWLGLAMLLGFDGIAFDQFTRIGMIWSSVLAAIVLLMVVQSGQGADVSLIDALRELARRWAWMLPAIAAVALCAFGLNMVQGFGRGLVKIYWQTSTHGEVTKGFVYFTFIFGFATLRLWITLAILVFALRESYGRGGQTVSPPGATASSG